MHYSTETNFVIVFLLLVHLTCICWCVEFISELRAEFQFGNYFVTLPSFNSFVRRLLCWSGMTDIENITSGSNELVTTLSPLFLFNRTSRP